MSALRFVLALPFLMAGDVFREVGFAVYGKRVGR